MNLEFVNQTDVPQPEVFLSAHLNKLAEHLRSKGLLSEEWNEKTLQLVFLKRSEAQKLNVQFRGKNYATDVLSFEAIEPDSFGELVFCPEVLEYQAKEHDLSYEEELLYMVIHGILHLLGYDHETSPEDEAEMFAIQDEAFAALLDKLSFK